MDFNNLKLGKSLHTIASVLLITTTSTVSQAGGFVFSDGNGPSTVAHPSNYTGNGGTVNVNVCIVPGSTFASNLEQSVRNNIAVWNKQQSTTSNIRASILPQNKIDFESVSLHEMGHCIGLSHPNLGFRPPNVTNNNTDYTHSSPGADGSFGFGAGNDGLIGSADDLRGDDVNLHYFNRNTNNPFAENKIVDSTTYTNDVAQLPAADQFPANADRSVSATTRYKSPFTEAAMQQGTFGREIQRTLGHDDVSTLRYGKSGLDESQGTADDYEINLTYGGISDSNCDINISMNNAQTSFAVCQLGGSGLTGSHVRITSANIFFSANVDWYYNDTPPCSESIALTSRVWKMISLPCQVGISTPATVLSVFADDLGTTNYGGTWVVWNYEYTDQGNGIFTGAYRRLTLTDELENGKGYWIITNETGKTVDVQGEFNSQLDAEVFVDSKNMNNYGWNMIGMPFRFPVTWADTQVVDTDGSVLSLTEADPVSPGGPGPDARGTACTDTTPPAATCKVSQFGYVYNGATNAYDLKSVVAGTVNAFDAAWTLAGAPGTAIRFPMPPAERATP